MTNMINDPACSSCYVAISQKNFISMALVHQHHTSLNFFWIKHIEQKIQSIEYPEPEGNKI